MTQDKEGIFPTTYLFPLDLPDVCHGCPMFMESLFALLSRVQGFRCCWGVSSQGNGVANEQVNVLLRGP